MSDQHYIGITKEILGQGSDIVQWPQTVNLSYAVFWNQGLGKNLRRPASSLLAAVMDGGHRYLVAPCHVGNTLDLGDAGFRETLFRIFFLRQTDAMLDEIKRHDYPPELRALCSTEKFNIDTRLHPDL